MIPYASGKDWTLYHGDCAKVLPMIEDGSVSSFITDLPYGMSLAPQRGKTSAIANDGRREARSLWHSLMPHVDRLAKPDTAHFFFSRWSETWSKEVLDEWFEVKGCVVWRKNVFGIGYYLRPQWEMAWYCHKGTPPVPAKAQSDVWDFSRVHHPEHSCEKPVDLLCRAVELCSPSGGIVVDPCAGLSSCGLACIRTGRKFIGIELDEGYCEIAAKRMREAESHLFANLGASNNDHP